MWILKKVYRGIIKLLNGLFLLGFLMFIFYPLAISLSVWNNLICKPERIHIQWSSAICKLLNLRYKKIPHSLDLQRNQKIIYLFNHKCSSDFFVHDVISQGQGNFLARFMVGMIFWSCFLNTNTVWLFVRGINRDYKKCLFFNRFNEWLDYKFERVRIRKGLVVYPEGHRMFEDDKPGKLKTGMMKVQIDDQYAYSRNIPMQACASFGNQLIMNQKEWKISLRAHQILYYFGQTSHPQNFPSQQQFIQDISNKFLKAYQIAYTAYVQHKKIQ